MCSLCMYVCVPVCVCMYVCVCVYTVKFSYLIFVCTVYECIVFMFAWMCMLVCVCEGRGGLARVCMCMRVLCTLVVWISGVCCVSVCILWVYFVHGCLYECVCACVLSANPWLMVKKRGTNTIKGRLQPEEVDFIFQSETSGDFK